ncbi:MAG TPA: DUF1345 domain-containing protein [Polyangiaceae bacterium]|nr:DUF1345 domain-containing protein [Polyangiaceae bacterium]
MAPTDDRAFAWYDPRAAQGRFVVTALVFVATAAGLGESLPLAFRLVAAWDAAAAVLLGLIWWIILRAGSAETRRRSAAEDPGRTLLFLLVTVACVFSLFASAVVHKHASQLAPDATSALLVLSLTAVAVAWLLTHTVYALRYAHLYYRDDEEGEGGLTFPGDRPPDDLDFAYFSFTLGMCFQVSDVVITSHAIRRDALVHAVLSFAYNTAILTTALNFALGSIG